MDTNHPDLAGRTLLTRNYVDNDEAGFRADRHGTQVAGLIAANAPTRAANENSALPEGQAIRTELVCQPVGIAVARHLVAARGDLGDQVRPALRHPSEDEERRAHGALVEQVEHAARVALDAGRQRVPRGR